MTRETGKREASRPGRPGLAALLALLAALAAPQAAGAQVDIPGLTPPPGGERPQGGESPPPAPGPGDEGAELTGPPPWIHTGAEGRVSISAGWGYRADPRDEGVRRRWYRRPPSMDAVDLPHSPNAWPVSGSKALRSWRGSVGWYRRDIDVPRDGRYAIRFESVHHRATVWVDGRRATRHTGAYLPFEARPALSRGRHTIMVRVDWRDPVQMKREGWHRAWFNYGGINREVTIRRLGVVDISAPALTTRLVEGRARVTLSVRLRNSSTRRRSVGARGTLTHAGREIIFDTRRVKLAPRRSAVIRKRIWIDDPVLWSPSSPALWDLRLVSAGAAWRGRVGLREATVRGGRVHLNGVPLHVRGASIHEEALRRGDALRPEDQDRLVAQLRAVGANATRAQHPLDPGLLERLDAAGIAVWLGIGPFDSPGQWTSNRRSERREARARVVASLEQLQTHPSILVWSLANEVAWNGRRGGQARHIDWSARTLHRRDPGRLVGVDVWGYRIPRRPGLLYRRLDVVGMTNYLGWYEAPYASDASVARLIRRRLERLRAALPRKALIVTEFGAEANDMNDEGRHGSHEYQVRLLSTHLRTYRALPDLSGMLIWNLTDFAVQPAYAGGSISSKVPGVKLRPGVNQKGLFTDEGAAKPSVEAVRSAFADIARAHR